MTIKTRKSFDFYDTLVTRMVGHPADVFTLIGTRLSLPSFRNDRIAAELAVRSVHGESVTLERIYAAMPLPDDVKEAARALEVQLERELLVPVRRTIATFEASDIIVSDMYHDEAFFRAVCADVMPQQPVAKIFISGLEGVSKSNGLLWQKLKQELSGSDVVHFGDNLHADIQQAQRNGFKANHVSDALLNEYENDLSKDGFDGSLLAGAAKATRASIIDDSLSEFEINSVRAFASVMSPLLYAFSEWVLRSCQEKGISRAFFLARDGILPYKICQAICRQRNLPIQCTYIYGSRQALHLPGFSDITTALDWLLEATHDLSLPTVAGRAGVSQEILLQAEARLAAKGSLPSDKKAMLAALLTDPDVVAAIQQASDTALSSAVAYYHSVGLSGREKVAFVDIGWNGRMQQSLRKLLDKDGRGPSHIAGHYLCLSRFQKDSDRDSYDGFLFRQSAPGAIGSVYDRYRGVLEAVFSSDHATTVGFMQTEDAAAPVFGKPLSDAMLRRIQLQHRTVETYTRYMLQLEATLGRPIKTSTDRVRSAINRFLQLPSRENGLAFCEFRFSDGQVEGDSNEIATIVRLPLRQKSGHPLGWWVEGTLAASGYRGLLIALYVSLNAKRLARRLKQAIG